jgi:hypothetical protein
MAQVVAVYLVARYTLVISQPAGDTEMSTTTLDAGHNFVGLAGRYVSPGERCHVVDEFGYWREEPTVTFVGTSQGGYYIHYREDSGQERVVTYHVIRYVLPCGSATAECECAAR